MSKQTAEEQLREVASASGKTMRDVYQLVDQVYRDEANYQKRIAELDQHKINAKQIALMGIELHNRAMEETLLQAKLNRHIRRLKRWEKVKSLFTKTKKTDGSEK